MFCLRFGDFCPRKTVVLIRPRNVTGTLLAINLVVGNDGSSAVVWDQTIVAPLTRRFGTLLGIHRNLRSALSGRERKVSGEVIQKRFGHITYAKRSNVELVGLSGKFSLMVPTLVATKGIENAKKTFCQ